MSKGLRFLIASGPTREPLDPVRYLSNYSTGTMGKYLAQAAKKARHRVTSVECPEKAETALELEALLKKLLPKNDVLVMAAAVCDVRPRKIAPLKIKKDGLNSIPLVKNPDILASLSKIKKKDQVFVGFALESQNIFENARKKMKQKSLDVIILQRVSKNINPFGDKPIEAFILGRGEGKRRFSSIRKQELAKVIILTAEKLAKGKNSP